MGLRFVLGASGSGKSSMMYERIIEEAIASPNRQFNIIVPDQYTMEIQKEMVQRHPQHAIMNIDVLSFGRLYHKVCAQLGGDERLALQDNGKSLILRKVSQGCMEKLPTIGAMMHKQGYITEVKSMISEMMQYNISPQDMKHLIEASSNRRGLQARLEDIQVLYEAFLKVMEEEYSTSETMYPILAKKLTESSIIKDSTIFFDGFTGFTPIQMPAVLEMISLARECTMAFTIDSDSRELIQEHQLFHMIGKTMRDLEAYMQERGEQILDAIWCTGENGRFRESVELAHLEKQLFRPRACIYEEKVSDIEIYEAKNMRIESFHVAKYIRDLVKKQGYQYRDIAIITPNIAGYQYHLEEAFMQLDIPYFLDGNSTITMNPMLELLRGLLEVVLQGFSYSSVMRYLRSGFSNITIEQVDELDRYLLEAGIRGEKSYRKEFVRKSKLFDLEMLNGIRSSFIEEIDVFLKGMPEIQSINEWCKLLYHYVVFMGIEEKLAQDSLNLEENGKLVYAKQYQQIYKKVMDVLQQMVTLLGEEEVTLEAFEELLEAGLEELQIGMIPSKMDQVLVGDLERTRLSHCSVLFVIGVNDSNIPGNQVKGGIISDVDREFLSQAGIELAPTTRQLQFRQRFYLYQQFTKASKKLVLSYALVDNAEKQMLPSYFIQTICKLFPNISIEYIDTQGDKPQYLAQLLEKTAILLREYVEGKCADTQKLSAFIALLQEEIGYKKTNLFVEQAFIVGGVEHLDSSLAKELYGAILYGSVSRLEQYAMCPYRYFLKYGMQLKEAKEYELEAADLGTIMHDVLADFGAGLVTDGYTWDDFPEEYAQERIDELLEKVRLEYGEELLLDTARNGYALSRAKRILNRSVGTLKEHMRVGGFQTYGLEMDFQVDCNWDTSRELLMHLQGRVDRVDIATLEQDVYVKVIDYKSGNKKIELDCMYAGLQMQLIVYLDSISKRLSESIPEKMIKPGAMFYYKVQDPMIDMEGKEDFEELEQGLMKEQRVSGLLNEDERVVTLLDQELEGKSHVIPVEYKKDGSFSSTSSVCSEVEFDQMRRFINRKMYHMATDILEGHIEKSPYKKGTMEDGCMYCPYDGVCGFDEKITGYQHRVIQTMSKEEALEAMNELE
ncbi:MAG: PD-(D/E)XK nuclease family protein [Lachnospiraceae bacterium]